jgi:hypothetical protein
MCELKKHDFLKSPQHIEIKALYAMFFHKCIKKSFICDIIKMKKYQI